jgi:hypothetical protein
MRVITHIVFQPLPNNEEHKRLAACVGNDVGSASAGKAEKIASTYVANLFVDKRYAMPGKNVQTFFFIEMPVIFAEESCPGMSVMMCAPSCVKPTTSPTDFLSRMAFGFNVCTARVTLIASISAAFNSSLGCFTSQTPLF